MYNSFHRHTTLLCSLLTVAIQSTATLKFTNEQFFQPITHEQNKNPQGNLTIQSFSFSFQDVAEQKPYDEIRVDFNIYFYMWFSYINTW